MAWYVAALTDFRVVFTLDSARANYFHKGRSGGCTAQTLGKPIATC